eukprot:scaffold1928_cov381-Prasinococcus_capsulatus_cf.AAC.14
MRLLFVVLALLVALAASTAGAIEELKVETTHKPADCSKKSAKGDKLSMHYDALPDQPSQTFRALPGRLESGKEFDSSRKRGRPFEFTLGAGQVIKGWDNGLEGMCIGEKRTLTIPPNLGYGDRGAGGVIPGGATLVFEVELLGIN